MKHNSNFDNTILLYYFSFTSLSTVGFGDYAPRSNLERVIGAMMLMLGVAIFSYIMGIFIEILEACKNLTVEYGEGERLAMFMGTLRKFNKNVAIDADFTLEIVEYFSYRWKCDKSREFNTEQGLNCMDQLPKDVQIKILKDYMFIEYLKTFNELFKFPIIPEPLYLGKPLRYAHLGWNDEIYQKFMKALLFFLEPRLAIVGEILVNENQEGLEVIFVQKGFYSIGFEINKVDRKVIKCGKGDIIGSYECTFSRRSLYKYQVI